MKNKLRRTTPSSLAAFIELSGKDIVYGAWDSGLHPCPEGCDVVHLFSTGGCYRPCSACGATLSTNDKTGRRVYIKETFLWLFTKKKFLGYQWRD